MNAAADRRDVLKTPIVLILFNRPELTRQIFAAVREMRPERLLIIADGPRDTVPQDVERCAATRAAVAEIDWPCEVQRKYAEANLGLRPNVLQGLSWAFEQVEEAIILEDDCLPDRSFFPFCEALLERYRDDRRIGVISGTNLDPAQTAPLTPHSYYFSRFCHIWGWATWRRAWQLCDPELREWPALRSTDWLPNRTSTRAAENFWRRHFDDSHTRRRDGLNTWDVAWTFACWRHDLLTVIPREKLVTNLGFGADATHTTVQNPSDLSPARPIGFPLDHPGEGEIVVNEAADRYIQEHYFEGITKAQRLYWKLRLPIPIWLVRRLQRWLRR